MKKYCYPILLSLILLSCRNLLESSPLWRSYLLMMNNSSDTIYCSIYRRDFRDTTFLRLSLHSRPISPMDYVESYIPHDGGSDSWRSLFSSERIDTLFVVVSKNLLADYCSKPDLLNAQEVLKVFKITKDNFEMNQEHVTFEYP